MVITECVVELGMTDHCVTGVCHDAHVNATTNENTTNGSGSLTVQFAAAARLLNAESQRFGLDAPSFRSPPRVVGVDRTVRRREHGGVVAARHDHGGRAGEARRRGGRAGRLGAGRGRHSCGDGLVHDHVAALPGRRQRAEVGEEHGLDSARAREGVEESGHRVHEPGAVGSPDVGGE